MTLSFGKGFRGDACSRCLAGGFDEEREGQFRTERLISTGKLLKRCGAQPKRLPHPLGHDLIQTDRLCHDPRPGVRYSEQLQQCRDLCLAAVAVVPLRDIEADVWLYVAQFVDQFDVGFEERDTMSSVAQPVSQP